MPSLSSRITKTAAKLTIAPLIALTGVTITVIGMIANFAGLPMWIGLGGLLSFPLCSKASSIAQEKHSTNLFLQDPENPSAGNEDHPFQVEGETLKLRGEAFLPDWVDGANIWFQENSGYSVQVSNYPKGVETRERRKNQVDIEDGVDDFPFTVIITRDTNIGGTYEMEVRDKKNEFYIDDYEVEITSY